MIVIDENVFSTIKLISSVEIKGPSFAQKRKIAIIKGTDYFLNADVCCVKS